MTKSSSADEVVIYDQIRWWNVSISEPFYDFLSTDRSIKAIILQSYPSVSLNPYRLHLKGLSWIQIPHMTFVSACWQHAQHWHYRSSHGLIWVTLHYTMRNEYVNSVTDTMKCREQIHFSVILSQIHTQTHTKSISGCVIRVLRWLCVSSQTQDGGRHNRILDYPFIRCRGH